MEAASISRSILHQACLPASSPIVSGVGKAFDVRGFESARAPLEIAPASLSRVPGGLRLSSLPIKFPGSEYRVPLELGCVREALEEIASAEHSINSAVDDYYAYLTIQSALVESGTIQRGGAIHSDGIQGPRIQPKAPVERGYL